MSTLKFRDIHGDVQVVNEKNDVSKKTEALEEDAFAMAFELMQKDLKIEKLEDEQALLAFELAQLQKGGM